MHILMKTFDPAFFWTFSNQNENLDGKFKTFHIFGHRPKVFSSEPGTPAKHALAASLRTGAFTHRRFVAQKLLHREAYVYAQKLLRTEACQHRSLCTQKLSRTDTSAHKNSYTKIHLHIGSFNTNAFTHIHTQTLLHKDAFTHRRFYKQTLLHTDAFTHLTHGRFYTHAFFHTDAFTHSNSLTNGHFYTNALHADTFTHRLFTRALLHKTVYIYLHTETFTHRHLYHTNAFIHRHFFTQPLLHAQTLFTHDAFTHMRAVRFYTHTLLHTITVTHRLFLRHRHLSTQTLLHTDIVT